MVGLDILGFALPLDKAEYPMLGHSLACRAYRQVDGMADPAGGQTHVAMKIIRVLVSQSSGHGLRLAGDQSIESAAGREMEGVTDIEQPFMRLAYADMWPVSQPTGCQRPQHRNIAEASAGLLEIRFEQIGGITKGGHALIE